MSIQIISKNIAIKKIIKKYEEHREKVFKRVMFDYCLKYCRKPEEVSVEELE